MGFVLYLWLATASGEPKGLPMVAGHFRSREACEDVRDKLQAISARGLVPRWRGACLPGDFER